MSIAQFTETLRNKAANAVAKQVAQDTVNRVAQVSTALYTSGNKTSRAASIINKDADALRNLGAKQGSTRLVVTEDSLSQLLGSFNLQATEKEAITKYLEFLDNKYGDRYKVKHFEFYTDTNEILPGTKANTSLAQFIRNIGDKNIIAIRGLNFSHNNTLTHMAEFIKYSTDLSQSIDDIKKAITTLYDRGHVEAVTTARQIASIGGISKDMDVLDKIVQLSKDLDIASSSLASPKYSKIISSINKDFNGPRMFMNIEFQLKRSDDGKGNQDSADITRGLQIISSLAKLIDNLNLSSRGALLSKPTGVSLSLAAKEFDNLAKKLDKQKDKIAKVLAGYISNPESYVADIQSSDSAKQHIEKVLVASLKGKVLPNTKVSHRNQVVYTVSDSGLQKINTKDSISKLVDETRKDLTNAKKLLQAKLKPPISKPAIKDMPLSSLQALLNANLMERIVQNMGTGDSKKLLNFRTGRFAASANVERLTVSREGMITAFYTYLKYPYQTFEPGYRMGYPKSRDPKLLISKSIREIAATAVATRLRAVLI